MHVSQERRARENAALIERMRAGETLSLVAPQATWWQPRALTKKDPAEMARVMGEGDGREEAAEEHQARPAPPPRGSVSRLRQVGPPEG